MDIDDQVSELTCASFAVDEPPALHDGAAYAGANRQHHDARESTRSALSRLADQSHTAVVHNCDRSRKRSLNGAFQIAAGQVQKAAGQNFARPTIDPARNADSDRDSPFAIHLSDQFFYKFNRFEGVPAA
jgi:hypothetical protein